MTGNVATLEVRATAVDQRRSVAARAYSSSGFIYRRLDSANGLSVSRQACAPSPSESGRSWQTEKRERMLALLDEISANRERLRSLYGEFDVDNAIYAAREQRDRYLAGL